MSETFYRAFEDRFRGSRDLIKSRQRFYVPHILRLKEIIPSPVTLDLGCGRGEWLELLGEHGFDAHGVDLDDGMLAACHQFGLRAKKLDALTALRAWPADSLAVVSGFHIAEHVPFDVLQLMVQEALRVLKPGGLLILETPNPDNVAVATSSFYLDPTHQRPIPSQLLSFLAEHYGFARVKVVGLNAPSRVEKNRKPSLVDVLYGASPDYAVVAQKAEGINQPQVLDDFFKDETGITTLTLASLFDQRIEKLEYGKASVFRDVYRKARSVAASLKKKLVRRR